MSRYERLSCGEGPVSSGFKIVISRIRCSWFVKIKSFNIDIRSFGSFTNNVLNIQSDVKGKKFMINLGSPYAPKSMPFMKKGHFNEKALTQDYGTLPSEKRKAKDFFLLSLVFHSN